MNIWFSADIHLGHANIAAYCKRPWLKDGDWSEEHGWVSDEAREDTAERMNRGLIRNWNSRVAEGDVVYHIGDFCNKGRNRGVRGTRTPAADWETMLRGKIIHIRGNHDGNNGVRPCLNYGEITFAGMKWFLVHQPPNRIEEIPEDCDAVICGHVHELWSERMIEGTHIPMINVGVDVRKYAPVRLDEVAGIYNKMVKED